MNYGAYDQGPPQGDMGGYNYEAPAQDFSYQNNNNNGYGGGPSNFAAPPTGNYDQGYGAGKFEGV